jgi:branched-chain amino acid transport system permease protein
MSRQFSWLLVMGVLYVAALFLHGNIGPGVPWFTDYYMQVLMLAEINIIVTIALNLINGFTGQFSICQAAFMAIGGYVTATLAALVFPIGSLPLGEEIAAYVIFLLIGGVWAGFAGLLVGLPTLRLKGDYLAIVTLAFGEVVTSIIRASDEIADGLRQIGLTRLAELIANMGGPRGFGGLPKLRDLSVDGIHIPTLFTLVFVFMLFSIWIASNLVRSSYGRAWLGVRGDEIAAEMMGVNSTKSKALAFLFCGFLAGIAGGLFGFVVQFLHPNEFGFLKSIEYLIFLYAGGIGSISGSILAASSLTILPEALRIAGLGDWRLVFYAILLIGVMLWRPSGLLGDRELTFLVPSKRSQKQASHA